MTINAIPNRNGKIAPNQRTGSGSRSLSLRNRLLIAFILLASLPVLLTSVISGLISARGLRSAAFEQLGSVAQLKTNEINSWLSTLQVDLGLIMQDKTSLAHASIILQGASGSGTAKTALRTKLNELNKSTEYFEEVFLVDTNGTILLSTNESQEGKIAKSQSYFHEGIKGSYIEPPSYDVALSAYSIIFSQPVQNRYGQIIGVIAGRANLAVVDRFMAEQTGLGEKGETYLVGANYALLSKLRSQDAKIGETYIRTPGTTNAIESKATGSSLYNNYNNVPVLGAHIWIPQLQIALISEHDQSEALQASNQALAITIGLVILSMLVAVIIAFLVTRSIVNPISQLLSVAENISSGNLEVNAPIQRNDEIGVLSTAFNRMTAQLRGFIGTLESRVAERTRNLELAAEVGRTVSQVRALDVMLTDAAELIRKQFDLYYVQVYLVNPSQTYLDLQAGTGDVGEQLLARNHRLPFDTSSINGRAAIEKKSVVISDTAASPTFKANPLLPATRSEMAVPLLIGDKVVGVLDMQSEQAGSLSEDGLSAFEALAGQLAIAIQNATFLAETEQARSEVETQARRLTRSNWADYLDAIHKPEETGFLFEQNKITPLTQAQETQSAENRDALVAPITVTGESLGNLVLEMEGRSPIARTDELLTAVAHQVAQQIENLRLLDSAERYRAEAEESSRRLTREGWKTYAANANENMSYFYDLKEVKPYQSNGGQKVENAVTLPLKVRDETVGKLVVQGLESSDSESMSLANAIAERLGAHIESLRQFDETKRGQIELDKRAQQLAAVAEISTVSSKELDIDKMLASVVHLTQRKFELYHAHVFIYNENTEELKIAACGWQEGDEHEGTHGAASIPLMQEQSLVARAARTRQPIIVNDVHNEPGWLPNSLLPDTASELAVPLLIGDQVLGVLDVQSDRLNAFTEEDASIQTTLAAQVATALQNARSFARAQQQADRESTLNTISQKIQSATTVEAVLQIAARELGHALGAPMTIAQLSMKDKK